MPSSSYIRGLITRSQATETTLTEAEECRLADVIDDGLTPLTAFENNLIQILAGKTKPCCPKEFAMEEFASKLDGGRRLKHGLGWEPETEGLMRTLRAEQARYEENQEQFQDWTDHDWGAHYANSSNPNEQEMGRMILSGAAAMKEVDAETRKLLSSSEDAGEDDQCVHFGDDDAYQDNERKGNYMTELEQKDQLIRQLAQSMIEHANKMTSGVWVLLDEAATLRARANLILESLSAPFNVAESVASVNRREPEITTKVSAALPVDFEDDIPF